MRGPDDLPPVAPHEIDSAGGCFRGHWCCPRCEAKNVSELASSGTTPAICRSCFDAVLLASAPKSPRMALNSVWLSVMPDGSRIEIKPHERGGFRYDVEKDDRYYGGYDSMWNRQDAYEVALRAVQSRRKRH